MGSFSPSSSEDGLLSPSSAIHPHAIVLPATGTHLSSEKGAEGEKAFHFGAHSFPQSSAGDGEERDFKRATTGRKRKKRKHERMASPSSALTDAQLPKPD